MANVKNFGLIGAGSDLQFGKAGTRLINNSGTFNFKAANGTSDAAITAAGVTANSGNLTATTGNLVLSSESALVSLAGTTLSRHAAGVLKLDGSAAVMLPAGNNEARPTGAAGMMRYNTSGILEYHNGTVWVSVATGGGAVTAVTVATANGFAGDSSGGTTPALTLRTTVTGLLKGDGASGTITNATTTGTGDVVLATSPTLITPNIGAATATTINGLTVSTTNGTLDLADESTFATSGGHSLTLTTTGATNVTLPTSGTLLSTDNVATYAVTSFSGGTTGLAPSTATSGEVTLSGTLNVANGGTGATTLTSKGVVYGNGTGAVGVTAAGTQYQVLQAGADGTPAFGAVNLGQSAAVTGTLGATNGGTGVASFAAGNVLYASANNTWAAAQPGSTSGVQKYDADLDAVAGLTNTGYAIRTGDGSWTTRSIAGTADQIVVTNGSGATSDTSIGLATVTQGTTGSFVKVTVDSYGRVTGNTAVVAGDITALVNDTYVNVAGDTMSGDLNMGGTHKVTGLAEPTQATDAATKNYVDNIVSGLSWKQAVSAMAITNIPLTGGASLEVDGVTLANGNRVLLTGQSDDSEDGIYVVSGIGSTYVLTRAADAEPYTELVGAAVFVTGGSTRGDTGWVQTNESLTSFAGQSWVQFSGAGAYSAGDGIVISGNVISAKIGNGLAFVDNAIVVDTASDNAVQLVAGPSTADVVGLVLDTGSGLEQSANGLKISTAGVTNAMLANSSLTLNAGEESGTVSLGGTLSVDGTSTQGIDTTVSGSTITVTALDATSTQKGVAKFGADFTVTAGDVALTHKSITFGGDTGTTSTNLGSTFNIVKASGSAITTAVTAGQVAIGVATATDSVKGVASFSTDGFVVASGAVSLAGDVVQSAGTDSGDVTPVLNKFTIAGSGAISTSGTGSTATISVATATDSVKGVASFSSANFDVASGVVSIKNGGVDLTTEVAGILPVANGGTGIDTVAANQLFFGNSTANGFAQSAALSFNSSTSTLTLGSATIAAPAGGDVTITATGTDADINLVPNGTGKVVIGPTGSGVISSQAGQSLEVAGATTLTLTSGSGSTTMVLPSGTTSKVTVSGPTATEYATGLADADLVNKKYVDTAIASGAAAGAIKAFQATVSLSGSTAVTLGTMPAGATVLSVKVVVSSAADAGSLVVGNNTTTDAYMTDAENDTTVAGMYMAETFVTEAAATAIVATPAGGTQGSAKVIVTYQVEQ